MIKKRFRETERNCYYTSLVFDNQTQEELGTSKVVALLNEQQDIIGEQKIAIDELITDYKKLEKENEQLKSQRRNDAKEFSGLFKQNYALKRENEQLKKEKEKLKEGIVKRYLAMPHLNPEPEF